tara:strand:- start:1014 stop:1121 length:108 start_codon:yes stop_codon:yes gene_type:complete
LARKTSIYDEIFADVAEPYLISIREPSLVKAVGKD